MMRYHSCRIAPMLSQVSKFLHIKRFHLSSLSHKERLLLSKNHLIVQNRKLLKESCSYLLLSRQTHDTLNMSQDSKRYISKIYCCRVSFQYLFNFTFVFIEYVVTIIKNFVKFILLLIIPFVFQVSIISGNEVLL